MEISHPFRFVRMREEFITAIKEHQSNFRLSLPDEKISALADFYEIVMAHNDLLHLVAPCSPEIFAVRHVLESLTLLELFPQNTKFADVGTGAGLPSIPCLIIREDLRGFLIESSQKKADYLEQTVINLGLEKRARIINRQFEEISKPAIDFVTSRALDKFTKKLPALIKWAGKSHLAFFGGNNLREELQKLRINFRETLTPQSEQRFLFIT